VARAKGRLVEEGDDIDVQEHSRPATSLAMPADRDGKADLATKSDTTASWKIDLAANGFGART
jgi:hypothetical protein